MTEKPDYSAMTTNERLFTAGLLDAFDRAAGARDRASMIDILASVDIRAADETADAILANPRKYGF